jgi:hypothetical protein
MKDPREIFDDKLAAQGFLKTTAPGRLSGEQRSALIRKGNMLFNEGDIAQARRIFITAHYTDGLIRVGDYYMKRNEPLEAFRMYWLAPERRKCDAMIEQMAGVIRSWLEEPGDE